MIKVHRPSAHGVAITHADGDNAYVEDGHLYVEDKERDTVAVYAPGCWLVARRDVEQPTDPTSAPEVTG
jgi:hypothetical protein